MYIDSKFDASPPFNPKSAGAGQIGGIVRPEDDVATDRVVVAAFLWAAVLVSLAELVAAFALVGSLRPFRRPVCNAHGSVSRFCTYRELCDPGLMLVLSAVP